MSDKMLRHLIAFLGMCAFVITYWAGYMSGTRGWWAIGLLSFATYAIVYKLIDV